MADQFWSHWGWPSATAIVGLWFTFLVFKQYLTRRKLHQLAWSIGLFLYIPFFNFALTVPLKAENLVPEITVGGKAMPEKVRFFSFFSTIPGTFILSGGAVYSVIRFAAKKKYAYRLWANVLIAIGTAVIAFAGSLARTGKTAGLYPAEAVGTTFLLLGF